MPNKSSKNQAYKQYSRKFFRKIFPPNHNPLIGALQIDTLNNVHDAVALLQELATNSDEYPATSKSINMGYYLFTDCILSALRFEIYNRKK